MIKERNLIKHVDEASKTYTVFCSDLRPLLPSTSEHLFGLALKDTTSGVENMALWILYVLLLPCVRGAIFSTQFETALNSYIETSMKCHHVPGMTLAVVKGKQITLGHKQ